MIENFLIKISKQLKEKVKIQNRIDKESFEIKNLKLETNFNQNCEEKSLRKEDGNTNFFNKGHLCLTEITTKMMEEQKKQIEEVNERIKVANERYNATKVYKNNK